MSPQEYRELERIRLATERGAAALERIADALPVLISRAENIREYVDFAGDEVRDLSTMLTEHVINPAAATDTAAESAPAEPEHDPADNGRPAKPERPPG